MYVCWRNLKNHIHHGWILKNWVKQRLKFDYDASIKRPLITIVRQAVVRSRGGSKTVLPSGASLNVMYRLHSSSYSNNKKRKGLLLCIWSPIPTRDSVKKPVQTKILISRSKFVNPNPLTIKCQRNRVCFMFCPITMPLDLRKYL